MSVFLKLKAVAVETSIGASTLEKMVARGDFPKPVKIGGSNRWVASEVSNWIEQKIAERDAVAGGAQ